jgi:hypothetical protein
MSSSVQTLTTMGESSQMDAKPALDSCVERSLGIMCQKFVMLFLISGKASLLNYFTKSVG